MSKRASYRFGVEWIARNDNAGNEDSQEEIAGYVSTCLLADLFGKTQQEVASDIARYRSKVGLRVGAERHQY